MASTSDLDLAPVEAEVKVAPPPAPTPPAAPPPDDAPHRPARRRVGRRGVYVGAALLLVLVVVWSMRPSPLEVEVAAIDSGPLRVTIDEEGVTRLADRYRIAAPVAGRLLRIALREGDAVRAGQPVARIVPNPLDPRTLEAARARIAAAEAALRQSTARADQAREATEQAERELPRRRTLAAAGAISRESLEQLELATAARRHDQESARAVREAAAADVRAARAALLDASVGVGPAAAGLVEVRAPVSGRVLRIAEASERAVAPGEPLIDVGGSRTLEVAVDVLTTDAVRIRPGTPLLIDDWGGGQTLQGRVRSIEPEAFTRISALGVEEQRVKVIGDLLSVPPALGVGYRVEARFVVWSSPEVVRVPVGALFRAGGDWKTFVVEGGRARLRQVRVGARGEEMAQVLGGLRPGEAVVLYPSDKLEAGSRIRRRR